MAFLSVQRTMRSRPSTRTATKARPARHTRFRRLRAVDDATIERPQEAPQSVVLPFKAAPSQPLPYASRARAAGGPEDHALYKCGCGCMFEADVSAAVDCPHCGTQQNW